MPLLSLVAMALAAPPAPGLAGPSFACTAGQGAIETTICASPTLSAADREMAALYAVARVSAFGKGDSNELAAQRKALREMQNCAKPAGNRNVIECLRDAYDIRNADLALAALTRAPDLAIPVMRRADPVFAPIAEAIALWASEPENVDWSAPRHAAKRARILGLLEPTMTKVLASGDYDAEAARGALANPSDDGIKVTQLDDVLRSPRHFGAFLNVIGPGLPDDSSAADRAIPCAAVVTHPTLLNATASAYGSTRDNFVLNTNCEETLPATPALAALDAKLLKKWPECQGTIRFAAYRTYAVTLDRARLGFTQHDPKARLPRRDGVVASDIAAARSELAAYYARYLSKTPARAMAMAADALIAVLNDAQQCE